MTLFGLFGVQSIALVALVVVGQLDSVQHTALMTVYDATGCNATICPRFEANNPCSGDFVRCNGTNVVSLELNNVGLTGAIPSAVGQLTALTMLTFFINRLTGTIPTAVGQLTALTWLNFYTNRLTGVIPSAVGRLTALRFLSLESNGLTGTIPSAVGQLTALTALYVHNNAGLIGTIPLTFSRLSSLERLALGLTQLQGAIPSTIAPLTVQCALDSTFLDCASAPKSSCTCSARLLGDDCENRRPISTGSTSLSTVNATTCIGCASCTIQNDAWWEWTASCTGNATISTCGLAPIDTMLAIHRGACPSASALTATNEFGSADCDDFGSCGGNGQEQATLAVVSGERVIIRLGTVSSSSTATGALSISCTGLDCAGVVGGASRYDVCNVCGGDGSSCRDCVGVLNGSSRFDACGVCGGNGSSCRTPAPTPAPDDCVVSAYAVKAPDRCSVPACGGGNVTARATVVTPAQGSGRACPSLELVQPCNTSPCPAVISASGVRWRVVSIDSFETFVWPSFRSKLAYHLAVDENRLRLNASSAGSSSTIVEFTLLDAAGDSARNHVGRLAALAGDATSGLNVVTSRELVATTTTSTTTTTAVQPLPTPSPSADSTTTIIAAVVGSVGGLLLIGGIVACAVVARKKKQKSEQLEPATKLSTYEPAADASSLRRDDNAAKRASTYEPAADASSLRRNQPIEADNDYGDLDNKKSAKDDAYDGEEKKKPKKKGKSRTDDEPKISQGSLPRTNKRTTDGALHIPLDEVELGKKLGEGAFGVVYKGKWHGKNVAVKQVKASVLGGGDKAVADFEVEVASMAKITFHENLVQLYGVTTLENGDLAAVVEFCANGALVSALYGDKARADWTLAVLMSIAHGAACGVAHLHRQEMVHRDIAARNVLLTKSDDPKIADFGMARHVSDEVYEGMTMNPIGPLKWMAPEQMERRAYSKASDVFAFGVLLYEIFQQEAPWNGVSNIMTATKVVAGERMDVSARKIPRPIAALMNECWAATAKKRPSMEHVQCVLNDNLEDDHSSSF